MMRGDVRATSAAHAGELNNGAGVQRSGATRNTRGGSAYSAYAM
jgi:hypothetical protein